MKKLLLLGLLLFSCSVSAQNPPYWDDVHQFIRYRKQFQTPAHAILFVGSSSIRMWKDLQVVFGDYNVINRGIGGAVFSDISFYLNDIVFPYQPRQILIYVENDLPDETATAEIILERFVILYNGIRTKLPETPIAYISMKPSPSRDKFQQKAKASNALIKDFLSKEKNTAYIDIFTPMMKDGKSRPELFVDDMLHMNAKGYAIWAAAVRPYLIKYSPK